MNVMRSTRWIAASFFAVGLHPVMAEGDAVRGKMLYDARCSACHSLDANVVGPAHRGVFGRRAGSLAGYAYSDALKKAGFVWDAGTLDKWLTDPEKFVPGQRMGYSVPDAPDRTDLIAYLKKESGK